MFKTREFYFADIAQDSVTHVFGLFVYWLIEGLILRPFNELLLYKGWVIHCFNHRLRSLLQSYVSWMFHLTEEHQVISFPMTCSRLFLQNFVFCHSYFKLQIFLSRFYFLCQGLCIYVPVSFIVPSTGNCRWYQDANDIDIGGNITDL
jgi:hypothetical protein